MHTLIILSIFSNSFVPFKLFVETIGGDLTIKIEDNTDSGKGIFAEPVNYKEQGLDDADISYAIVDPRVRLE